MRTMRALAATRTRGSSAGMSRFIPAAVSIAACAVLPCAIHAADSVVLASDHQPVAGLVLEESTTIELNGGTMAVMLGAQPLKGAANALLRDRLTRSFESADEQRLEFHECTRSIRFAIGSKPGDPKLAGGKLGGKKVTGKREPDGGWKFTLADGKASAAEQNALRQFSAFDVAVRSVARLYGDEPREIGKPWRPDFSTLASAYPGLTVTIDCRLDELKEVEGDRRAKIAIGGLVTGVYGKRNRIEARFAGFITRSLRDQTDVEADLSGTLRFRGTIGKSDEDDGGGAEATLEAPLTLKRSVKVMKR